MHQYHEALQTVLREGVDTTDRTGTGTRSHFGMQMRFNLAEGFPLVTTKKLHLKSIFHELVWFMAGDTNIAYLKENGVSIWDEWADSNGDLGPVYGQQWRRWMTPNGETVDQIKELMENIRKSPDSRRLIVSAWNPSDTKRMSLPPCHTMWHVKINGGFLHLQLYQRSGDMFLGVPFNIACYAAIQMMLCEVTGYKPGHFIHTIGDAHIYSNHMDQVALQLTRTPGPLPTLRFAKRDRACISDFVYDDFIVEGYEPQGAIKAPVAV